MNENTELELMTNCCSSKAVDGFEPELITDLELKTKLQMNLDKIYYLCICNACREHSILTNDEEYC